MFTRSFIGSLLLVMLGAVPARALDIQGKWGFGVGAGFASAPDVSLIRGRSASSAWLFDVKMEGQNLTGHDEQPGLPNTNTNQNQAAIGFSAGLRSLARPSGNFTPYVDVSAGVIYSRSHQYNSGGFITGYEQRFDLSNTSVGLGLALGGEYMTPWHFSLAAHTGVASVNYRWMSSTQDVTLTKFEMHQNGVDGHIALDPRLVMRVYF